MIIIVARAVFVSVMWSVRNRVIVARFWLHLSGVFQRQSRANDKSSEVENVMAAIAKLNEKKNIEKILQKPDGNLNKVLDYLIDK